MRSGTLRTIDRVGFVSTRIAGTDGAALAEVYTLDVLGAVPISYNIRDPETARLTT